MTHVMNGAVGVVSAHTEHERRATCSGAARMAGAVALAGATLSVVGSILNQAVVDADIFAAMETASAAERARLLTDVAAEQAPLVAGFVIWMVAFPLVAMASVLLARLSRPSTLTVAVTRAATASIGAMIVFLTMFLAFVVVIAPAHVANWPPMSCISRPISMPFLIAL